MTREAEGDQSEPEDGLMEEGLEVLICTLGLAEGVGESTVQEPSLHGASSMGKGRVLCISAL